MQLNSLIKSLGWLAAALCTTLGLAAAADAATYTWMAVQYPNNTYHSGTITKNGGSITASLRAHGKGSWDPARFESNVTVNTNFALRYDFWGEYACTNSPARTPFPNNDYNVTGFAGQVNVNCTSGAQPGGARVFVGYR